MLFKPYIILHDIYDTQIHISGGVYLPTNFSAYKAFLLEYHNTVAWVLPTVHVLLVLQYALIIKA